MPRAVADPLARGLDVSEVGPVLVAIGVGSSERWNTVSRMVMHGGERIELAPLDAVEQPPQLGVVGDRILQMTARARRGDREHLGREVAAAALLERPVGLEPGRCASIASQSSSIPSPRIASVSTIGGCGPDGASASTCRTSFAVCARLRVVGLVDRDHVGDLHDPGLQRLHRVARARHAARARRCRRSRARRRRSGPVPTVSRKTTSLPDGVEQQQRLQRRLGEAAGVAARAHRADEDAGVEEVVGEADPVAEQRALRERARRVDRDDADRLLPRAQVADERRDQARLADAGRPGEARPRGRGP